MSLRLILWTLFLGYVGFLLASTKNASSLSIDIVGAFLGAVIGLALGAMFAKRARRRHIENAHEAPR
jgi:membrane associated rhomboid family serine protease